MTDPTGTLIEAVADLCLEHEELPSDAELAALGLPTTGEAEKLIDEEFAGGAFDGEDQCRAAFHDLEEAERRRDDFGRRMAKLAEKIQEFERAGE